jgi:hypothetical protein
LKPVLKASALIVIEQSEKSLNLYQYQPTGPTALVLGNEVTGVLPPQLVVADAILELPMIGQKESLNVAAPPASPSISSASAPRRNLPDPNTGAVPPTQKPAWV